MVCWSIVIFLFVAKLVNLGDVPIEVAVLIIGTTKEKVILEFTPVVLLSKHLHPAPNQVPIVCNSVDLAISRCTLMSQSLYQTADAGFDALLNGLFIGASTSIEQMVIIVLCSRLRHLCHRLMLRNAQNVAHERGRSGLILHPNTT